MTRYVKWIEPYDAEANGCVELRMTVEDVIKCQRARVAQYRPDFQYESDQQAIDDFCTVHWGTIVEEK
jgi:hypothetical protein